MRDGCLEISDVQFKDKDNPVPPIMAFFENGSLSHGDCSKVECGVYRDNENPDKYVAAVCTDDQLIYMGTEPDEEPYRTLLAIQENGSKKVKLIEVDKVILKPKPVGIFNHLTANIDEQGSYSALYKKFGSKQIKRKTEQREKMSFKVESFADRLNETAATIKLDDSFNMQDSASLNDIYIECNRNATNINDVYKLDDLISYKELEELYDEAQAALTNTAEVNAENYSAYFNANIKSIPDDDKVFRTCVLMYSESIIQFLNLPYSVVKRKSFVACPLSSVINSKITKTFTENSTTGRVRPQNCRSKAICHAIVAGLIACNYTLEIQHLCKFLKMASDKLIKLCRTLGATTLKGSKTHIVLKLPLPPILKPMLKRKKM